MEYSKEYLEELIEMFQLYLNDDTRMLAYNLGLKIIDKYYTPMVSRNLIEGNTKIFFNIPQKRIIWYRDNHSACDFYFNDLEELLYYEIGRLNNIILILENMLKYINYE